MMSLNTGAPHFKSIAKQHRHANYTLEKVINEGVDNIIKKASEIRIYTDVDSDNRLQEIRISDNYTDGFESINEEGIQNPFNMGHIKSGHDDDDETSEFGVGLKAGALSAANQLSIISRVGNDYYQVICDFIKMEKEEDVNASYNPKIRNISQTEYKQFHPFDYGSSIIMSKIRETICERMSPQDLTLRIKKGISNTYSRFLNQNKKIFVNDEPVEHEINLFDDPKCKPFTIIKKLFVLEKGNDKIIIGKKTIERSTWQSYNKKIGKWEVLKHPEIFIEEKIAEGYHYPYPKRLHIMDMSCIDIETTFAFYSDKFHTGDKDNEPEKPFDHVAIYKDDRKYCNKSLEYHHNGSNNFTGHKIEFSSKKIGKELGITFNKEITMDTKNDLTTAIRLAIKDNRKEFSADINTTLNKESCEKAILKGIINFETCNIEKLSSVHKGIRLESQPINHQPIQPQTIQPQTIQPQTIQPQTIQPQTIQPQPVDLQPIQPQPVDHQPINHQPIQPETIQPQPIQPEPVDSESIVPEPVDHQPINHQPIQPEPLDLQPIQSEPVDSESIVPKPVDPQPIDYKPDDLEPTYPQPIDYKPDDLEPTYPQPIDSKPIEPAVLLIEASELLKKKALCENFNITIEDSMRILNFVKNILKI
jgi:hypothetical protein